METEVGRQALRLRERGAAVIPICGDGSKAPALKGWKQYQERLPTEGELRQWFRNGAGIALICGQASRNVECIDFDDTAAFAGWWSSLKSEDDPFSDESELLERLVITETPGPGMQVWYRCEAPVAGNQKLARRQPNAEEIAEDEAAGRKPRQWVVLIETRGEGGYAIIPPSPGCCHPSGRPYKMFQGGDMTEMPTLTAGQREMLLEAARAMNQYAEDVPQPRQTARRQSDPTEGLRPGDDFNQRGDIRPYLRAKGWTQTRTIGTAEHWRRPGSEHRCSATIGAVGEGCLYVFSTNAAPFEPEKRYTPFAAYTYLEHGGDWSAAGKALYELDYGDRRVKGGGREYSDDEAPVDAHTCSETSPVPEDDWCGVEDEGEAPRPLEAEGGGDGDAPEEGESKKPKMPSGARLAAEFSALAKSNLLFLGSKEWAEFLNDHWSFSDDDTRKAQIEHWLKAWRTPAIKHPSTRLVTEVVGCSKRILCPDARPFPREEFDANRNLIPLANGMLDTRTRVLMRHDPSHRNTYTLDYEYDPAATCPRFDQFIEEALIDSDGKHYEPWADLLLQWLGYCLIPDCRAETVLFNLGPGGNGKSVFTRVLEGLVGDGQATTIEPVQLTNHPEYAMADLSSKLVAVLNEPTRHQLTGCNGKLKAIVSGDVVKAGAKYQANFDLRPFARIVVNTNALPDSGDVSKGWFRRILIVKWRFCPPHPDRSLSRKLLLERPGILNRALDGLARLRQNGWEFPEPEESRCLKDGYRKAQDNVEQWREECTRDDPQARFPMAALYVSYQNWCRRSGETPLSLHVFGERLPTERYPSLVKRVAGRPARMRDGIRLYAEDYDAAPDALQQRYG